MASTLVTNSQSYLYCYVRLYRLIGASNDFSGLSVVIAEKSDEVILRRPLEVGLYFLITICFPSFIYSCIYLDTYISKSSMSFESAVNVTIALRRLFV